MREGGGEREVGKGRREGGREGGRGKGGLIKEESNRVTFKQTMH